VLDTPLSLLCGPSGVYVSVRRVHAQVSGLRGASGLLGLLVGQREWSSVNINGIRRLTWGYACDGVDGRWSFANFLRTFCGLHRRSIQPCRRIRAG